MGAGPCIRGAGNPNLVLVYGIAQHAAGRRAELAAADSSARGPSHSPACRWQVGQKDTLYAAENARGLLFFEVSPLF